MRLVVCLLVCLAASAPAEAVTRTVCASGCKYTDLQAAIDAAAYGDVILLRAGQTFVGNYTLPVKPGTATGVITIRSDAAAANVPGAGIRLIPEGKPGANIQRRFLPRLVGKGGTWKNSPIIRVPPGAHHYRLELIEIDGAANVGYGTLVSIGSNDSTQTTAAAAPHTLVLDRVWIHGHPTKGQRRAIAANARALDIVNSYIDDIASVSDSQAIGVFNAPGPLRIINNYLEATGENFLSGGADPKTLNLVPSDIEFRGNHFTKDPAWRNPVLAAPARPTATATTGGRLIAGTHYFKVVAVLTSDGANIYSAGSAEASLTVKANAAVKLSWPAVKNAEKYRVYRGTTAGGEASYLEAAAGATSMTYTGAGEKKGTPRTSGTRWTSKNLLELKNAQRVIIDGNLFEHNWSGFQTGYAILFTPKNQEKTAPWTTVRDVVFTNNVVRHVANGINISGSDWRSVTQEGRNFRIANNVFDDVSPAYGGKGAFLLIAGGPRNIVIDHNTIVHEGPVLEVEGPAIPGFVYTNNYSRHNRYGIKGQARAVGTDTLRFFFPGFVFKANVLAGGNTASYPAGSYFPSTDDFMASFVNTAAGNLQLTSGSAYRRKATDGTDIGVNMATLTAAQEAHAVATALALDVSRDALAAPAAAAAAMPAAADPLLEMPMAVGVEALPGGWRSSDVGAVGKAGSATQTAGCFTVKGAGLGVAGTVDALHFVWRALAGDGEIVARVARLAGPDPWTKVGVMIRQTLDAGSAQALMLLSAGKGLHFQRRTVTGAGSRTSEAGTDPASQWVKLTRIGSVITAARSSDGRTWTIVGRDTFSIVGTVYIGLAVSSHQDAALATGVFDNVVVR